MLLALQPNGLAEWLADAAAFDAAGADALFADFTSDPELDPLALVAALAVVTFRALLVTTLPARDGRPPSLARTLTTLGRLSHGRLRILGDAVPVEELADLDLGLGVFRRIPGDPDAFEQVRAPDEVQRWVSAPLPDSRAEWWATLRGAAERGCRGLLVPADPRLLDLLRNPEDPGDRRDLQLATG